MATLNRDEMRRRATQARVARVATYDDCGQIHLVPVTFVLDGERLYSPSDAGPRRAKRLRNLEDDSRVAVLIDVYDEDWSRVWWVRLRGAGRAIDAGPEYERARTLLAQKYPQFRDAPPGEAAGPIMIVDIADWSGWAYSS
jgi:PPOX class probable F420-dependent enzyme